MTCMNWVLEVSGTITNDLAFISLMSQKGAKKYIWKYDYRILLHFIKRYKPTESRLIMPKQEKDKINADTSWFFFENRTNKNSSEQSEKINTLPVRKKQNDSFLSEIWNFHACWILGRV